MARKDNRGTLPSRDGHTLMGKETIVAFSQSCETDNKLYPSP
jgi:hypothetical protein